ncbi:hypothetical protein J6590_021695 [Homalodisca vitripennis]|nr:hypothetical protein J6590_021695 [Homalodisca vitripennis]
MWRRRRSTDSLPSPSTFLTNHSSVATLPFRDAPKYQRREAKHSVPTCVSCEGNRSSNERGRVASSSKIKPAFNLKLNLLDT